MNLYEAPLFPSHHKKARIFVQSPEQRETWVPGIRRSKVTGPDNLVAKGEVIDVLSDLVSFEEQESSAKSSSIEREVYHLLLSSSPCLHNHLSDISQTHGAH